MNETKVKIIDAGEIGNRKRVAIYARVSTDYIEQRVSYDNQIETYTKKVQENPEWMLAGIYADPAITGTTEERPQFQKMLKDAEAHKFDIILCKSISRFARNTLVSIQNIRRLREIGITAIFEKENLDTSDEGAEMMLTIMSAFAQEESRNISDRVKKGMRFHYQNGDVFWSPIYGYRKVEDEPFVIEETEAAVIRRIFDEYEKGKSTREISDMLNEEGVPSPKNENWSYSQIATMLGNEKYVGDYITNKYYIKDHLSHSLVRNNGEVEQVILKNHHAPIISRDQFERVQAFKKMKSDGGYPFSEKVICPLCGRAMTFEANGLGERKSIWKCDADEFYILSKPLLKKVPEAYAELDAEEHERTAEIKAKFPEFETCEHWWVDELIESITFGLHDTDEGRTLIINWTCGKQTEMPSGTGLMRKNIYRRRILARRCAAEPIGERKITKRSVAANG